LREIGVRADDGRGVASKLENGPLRAGRPGDGCPGAGASRECDRVHCVGGDKSAPNAGVTVEKLNSLLGKAGLEEDLDKARTDGRSLRRRLHDGCVAGCEARRRLVRQQIDRRVERRDREDGAERYAEADRGRSGPPAPAFRRQ